MSRPGQRKTRFARAEPGKTEAAGGPRPWTAHGFAEADFSDAAEKDATLRLPGNPRPLQVRTMALDKELLRKSFALFVACEPDLTHHFYEVLFARHAELRKLFTRKPLTDQERMLTDTIVDLIAHIDDLEYLEKILHPLGLKHVEYGATAEAYAWVRDALLATFRHVAGAVWTDELAAAWREAYDLIASIMMAGATTPTRGRT
jgi:hemoglobin-like flavoprotein